MIEIPKINCEKTTKDIVKFIERKVKEANSKGVVVGLSGGIDSTVTAFLVTQAIGNENVFGVIMPSKTTPKEDTAHGEEIAKLLNIKYKTVEIDSIQDEIINLTDEEEVVSSIGNLKARIRMSILYYFANNRNYLVGGTGNKSEILIGYFTKFGDGASDFEPIADLYKTQVWQLSEYLKIPSEIIEKPPRAGLWNNQTDEDEIGMDYELLDKILYLYNDKNITEEKISQTLEINVQETEKIIQKIKNNEHKNKIPESPGNSN
ncbi:MAG: NAD+ synthase [archaeon]|nr:NAD+ synthase [archaeon]